MSSEDLTRWLQRRTSRKPAEGLACVSHDDAAVLVASVQDIQRRDAAWAAIRCADADRYVELWLQVVRLVNGGMSLPVLGLLGMASWIAGQGALANLVLDRAKRTDGYATHSLFELLEKVLRLGIHPRSWDDMRAAIVV